MNGRGCIIRDLDDGQKRDSLDIEDTSCFGIRERSGGEKIIAKWHILLSMSESLFG